MSALGGLLDLGAGALQVARSGIAVAGRNTANVDTPGYTRETLDQRAESSSLLLGGVRSTGPLRADTAFLDRREQSLAGEMGMRSTAMTALGDLENLLMSSGGGLGSSIANFFSGLMQVSAAPTDGSARMDSIGRATTMTSLFQSQARAIDTARDEADSRIDLLAGEVTALASELATLNHEMATSDDPVLADQRALTARRLSELVGGNGRVDSDGNMRFVIGGGAVLVDGARAAQLEAVPDATTGLRRLEIVDGTHRADITASLSGGAIAGEVEFRDTTATSMAAELDQFAVDFMAAFNGVHSGSAALDGSSGRNLFTGTGARDIAVDPEVAADPSLLAAAKLGAMPGDNAGVMSMLSLADQSLAAGGTRSFVDQGIELMAGVGRAASLAKTELGASEGLAQAIANARDAATGVSVEEEMIRMSQFQHASQAATNFVKVVDEMMMSILSMTR